MARSAPSLTRSSLVEDVDYLASCITKALGDESVEPQARAIAQFMLLCKDMSRDECASLFAKAGARRLFDKLLDCESEFMGPTPRAVGIDLVAFTTANKIQRSLDVKQYQLNEREARLGRVTPQINNTMLYCDDDYIWLRFHCGALSEDVCMTPFEIQETKQFNARDKVDHYLKSYPNGVSNVNLTVRRTRRNVQYEVVITNKATVFKVCDKVYEVYVAKASKKSNDEKLEYLLQRYGTDSTYSLIFCSELKHFQDRPLLFISNYLKFTYCYLLNQPIFDPKQYDEIKATVLYLSQCSLFMTTTNLNKMSCDTHGPLVAYTGERPKVALSKFKSEDDGQKIVYTNEGTRAMQTMNKSSDLGARSNYIEVVTKIDLDASRLDSII